MRLPGYAWQRQRFWIDAQQPEDEEKQAWRIFSEGDIESDSRLQNLVESIVGKYGREGVLAVNRRYLAPFGFIGSTQQCLFYFNLRGKSIVALLYIGPDEQYELLVKELLECAEAQGYQLSLIATEGGREILERLGFTTTPCGSLQAISDLRSFTLTGNRMRRLRYQVEHYRKLGECRTTEYVAGNDSKVDKEIVEIIDEWIRSKKKKVPFADLLKLDIERGTLDSRLRLFLTLRGELLESVILISPAPASNGYLMDLEFYGPDVAPGCLEFAITEIIEQLVKEGCSYFSLGGSFGTQLNSHPNADPEVERLFATLRQENVLNSDGNFQFKNKFRPENSTLYLCHPRGYDPASLSGVLLTLAGETSVAEDFDAFKRSAPKRASAAEMAGRAKQNHQASQFAFAHASRAACHPLLGQRLQLAIRDVIFQSQHSLDTLNFLRDHQVAGVVLLPGTAYVEMGLAAATEIFGDGPHALVELSIQQAMVFPEGRARALQLILKEEDNGLADFQILSAISDACEESPQWSLHASGSIRVGHLASAPQQGETIASILARCTEEVAGEDFYRTLERYGLEYGASFQGVRHVRRREGEAIAQVQVPDSLSAEIGDYRIHPAVLDACFQVFEATITIDGELQDDIYLLRGAEEARVYSPLPQRLWSHAVLHEQDRASNDLYTGDLRLYDESGKIVAEVKGIYAKRAQRNTLLRNTQEQLAEWLYEIQWRPLNRPLPQPDSAAQHSAWLIFSDGKGVAASLRARLEAHGHRCVLVHAGAAYEARRPDEFYLNPAQPEDFTRLLREIAELPAFASFGIVHLWSLDSLQTAETAQAIDEAIRLGCGSVLYLTQALVKLNLAASSRLWLATRGAQFAGTSPPPVELAQAPLWGLGRVIAVEHSEMWGGLIDLDADETRDDTAELSEELLRPVEGENQLVYRAGQRYVARLARSARQKLNSAPLTFKSEATYLITGGLGGLGLECARWLAEHGAQHLALVSRRDVSDELRERVSQIEKTGARVKIFKADVTQEAQVDEVLAEIKKSMPPLRGICQSAGVLDDGVVHKQTWEQFARVLEPKVRGSWLLHTRTRETPLDFFLLFSSAASMFGSAGQANHAAANAFLDALAHYRRAQGLQALSINWGAWSEVGEAAARKVGERLTPKGIDSIEPQQGWRVLEMIFKHSVAQVGVIPINWKQWKRLYLSAKTPPLMSELMQDESDSANNRASRSGSGPQLREKFLAAAPGERQAMVEEYLIQQTARVLRIDASALDAQQTMSNLGIDSIMTVELRDRIDMDWQVKVPLVEFFREPTIGRLAAILLEQLVTAMPDSASPQTAQLDPSALLSKLNQLSETEVDSLLDKMLPEDESHVPEPQTASF